MDKLPSKEFDKIYEKCKNNPLKFRAEVINKRWGVYVKLCPGGVTLYEKGRNLLEAYRSGEIRDAGAMVDTRNDEWYKLDPAVFDGLMGDEHSYSGSLTSFEHAVLNNNARLFSVFSRSGNALETDEIYMKMLYRAGIIRKGGAMAEKTKKMEWKSAFSVKDGQMRVDWDKLTVTKENALEISILSWKWAYEWMQENGEIIERDAPECALCRLYFENDYCSGCVIAEKTGDELCVGTPYVAFTFYAETKHEALDACRDEIAFLEGLR